MAGILVLGSLNVDFVVTAEVRPGPGETVTGSSFRIHPGGKGANQAVAAARAGGTVSMAGRVGDDSFSSVLKNSLHESGVSQDLVFQTPGTSTGCAVITVDKSGENSIVVVPGANGLVGSEDVDRLFDAACSGKKTLYEAVLLQLEIPLPSVLRAMEMAHRCGIPVMLDPAPAPSPGRELPLDKLRFVDTIMPNRHEASVLTGRHVHDVESAALAAKDLLGFGVKRAIVKLGDMGAVMGEGDCLRHVPGFKVEAVDTTAAGDTFAGALAVRLVEGSSLHQACIFANAAGAISVTRPGAQPSMPYRSEIQEFIRERLGDTYG
ncbi:MAG: ribokinase [Bacillota bacterium]|jgi:ribokinase